MSVFAEWNRCANCGKEGIMKIEVNFYNDGGAETSIWFCCIICLINYVMGCR